jgi:hypothetical protein
MPIQLQKIRQRFPQNAIPDVAHAVRNDPALLALKLQPGTRVAVAVGSRGIANLAVIVRGVIEAIRARGGEPFIIPAMGSHGGATAEGQQALLASFGVTENAMNCPVRSSMEVVSLPGGGEDVELFMDRLAFESDGIVLVNRIKPHTDFHGRHESGLAKMSVIGLGKERQALAIHRHGARGLRELVPRAAARILTSGKVLLGIGIVENARDETMAIVGVPVHEIMDREPELLELARRNAPRLPVDDLDVLVVDRLGKNISGTGMDTNVIGRVRILGEPEPESPRIRMIVVTDLTDESHGNATGTGLADVTTRRLFGKIDFPVTYTNIVTSSFLERAKIPIVAETDEQALRYALRGCGRDAGGEPAILRIRDTLHLGELYVSSAVTGGLRGRDDIEMVGDPVEMFDAAGALREF